MRLVISPAKTLDFATAFPAQPLRAPEFSGEAAELIEILRRLSPADISGLMDISDALARLNFGRYADWRPAHTPDNAKPALLAFAGDVYDGLDAASLDAAGLAFADTHLRILSGLYGVLRPLDFIQPYRLEMGTKLANARGKDLYAFWGERLRASLEAELAAQPCPLLVNLASEEYFKALQPKKLNATVIQPVFEDWSKGRYKIVSFYAKRARGLMVRYIIDHRLSEPEGMRDFDRDGYAFAPEVSDATTWVFRRRQE